MNNTLYRDNNGRRYPINRHPRKEQIIEDMLDNKSLDHICNTYDLAPQTVSSYRTHQLKPRMYNAVTSLDYRESENIYSVLAKYISHVNRVADSCLQELHDPDNPELLDVGVQAEDVRVSYRKLNPETGKMIRKRAMLQDLLDETVGKKNVYKVHINRPDRVRTLLEASHAMNKHLRLLGDLKGLIGSVSINITTQPLFVEFTQVVLEALKPYPEARRQVGAYLRSLALDQSKGGKALLAESATTHDLRQSDTHTPLDTMEALEQPRGTLVGNSTSRAEIQKTIPMDKQGGTPPPPHIEPTHASIKPPPLSGDEIPRKTLKSLKDEPAPDDDLETIVLRMKGYAKGEKANRYEWK